MHTHSPKVLLGRKGLPWTNAPAYELQRKSSISNTIPVSSNKVSNLKPAAYYFACNHFLYSVHSFSVQTFCLQLFLQISPLQSFCLQTSCQMSFRLWFVFVCGCVCVCLKCYGRWVLKCWLNNCRQNDCKQNDCR